MSESSLSVRRIAAVGFALLAILCMTVPVQAQQASPITVGMTLQIQLLPVFNAYGFGVSEVNATVAPIGPLVTNQMLPVELLASFHPVSLSVEATVNGSVTYLGYQLRSGVYGTDYAVDFTLPPEASNFTVTMQGSQSGSSFLWRYVTGIPYVTPGSGLSVYASRVTLLVPKGIELSQGYDSFGRQVALPVANSTGLTGGETRYDFSYSQVSTLVMQQNTFLPFSIAFTVVALAVIALAALNFFDQGRSLIGGLASGLNRKVVSPLSSARGRLLGPIFEIRDLFQPRKLLVLLVLCALLMVSLAAVAGPDPRVKAYVIADPSSVGPISTGLSSVAGNVLAITPAQDYGDFAVMSSMGEFNLVVISNYPSAGLPEVSYYVLSSLGNVPIIVYDNSANVTFVDQIRILYGSASMLHVRNAADLNQTEEQELAGAISRAARPNVLGLNISVDGFKALLIVEATLSFVLVFIGFAYLGSLTSEAGFQSDLSHLVTVVTSGILVFVFSEVIYVVTSSLLAVPLSLHAVVSGARDVTAVGLLGFGGGSTPRLAAGALGVLVGAVAVEGGPKVRVPDAALVGGTMLVLLVNPLSIGQYVFQALMLFVGPTVGARFTFGIPYANLLTVKGFLYGIGGFFGGGVSPQYLMSAGKILFFAGLVPLAYLKKMGRTTTVLALIVVAVMMGQGGIRVGEMTPDKTSIAIVPGVVAGFAFAAVLLAFALVEKYVRGNR